MNYMILKDVIILCEYKKKIMIEILDVRLRKLVTVILKYIYIIYKEVNKVFVAKNLTLWVIKNIQT